MNYHEGNAGEVVYLPAGTVHAIVFGEFWEPQNNGDTLRVVDAPGLNRPTQLKAALEAGQALPINVASQTDKQITFVKIAVAPE